MWRLQLKEVKPPDPQRRHLQVDLRARRPHRVRKDRRPRPVRKDRPQHRLPMRLEAASLKRCVPMPRIRSRTRLARHKFAAQASTDSRCARRVTTAPSIPSVTVCISCLFSPMDAYFLGRLCCPMIPEGVNIPPPPVNPPFFGVRKPNPGEVVDRGSLPSDPKPHALSTPKPKSRQGLTLLAIAGLLFFLGYPEDQAQAGSTGEQQEEQIDAAATTVEAPASELPPTEVPPASEGAAAEEPSAPQTAEQAAAPDSGSNAPKPDEVVVEEKPTPLNSAKPSGTSKL